MVRGNLLYRIFINYMIYSIIHIMMLLVINEFNPAIIVVGGIIIMLIFSPVNVLFHTLLALTGLSNIIYSNKQTICSSVLCVSILATIFYLAKKLPIERFVFDGENVSLKWYLTDKYILLFSYIILLILILMYEKLRKSKNIA